MNAPDDCLCGFDEFVPFGVLAWCGRCGCIAILRRVDGGLAWVWKIPANLGPVQIAKLRAEWSNPPPIGELL